MAQGLLQETNKYASDNRSDHRPDRLIRADLHAGLSADVAAISPKYFYDPLGSTLFEAICALPEYYPTRTEAAIFAQHADDIAATVGDGVTLIDLGAGNCAKAAALFPALKPRQYVPIDISAEFLGEAVRGLRQQFPQIPMQEIAMDFSASLVLPSSVSRENRLFFFPGSSLGNFAPDEALQFLRRMRHGLQLGERGGVLLGVDMVKDKAVLDAAYSDALGVTAAFNLNVLRHVNRLVDADFNPADWEHCGFFNPELQRVEMHLQARHDVGVSWDGGERLFSRGERIHTENSYKFTPDGFRAMLEQAGFGQCIMWFDPDRWFMVCYACPE